MRRVLQTRGQQLLVPAGGGLSRRASSSSGCAVANGSKLFSAKNGFEQKLLWLDRYS
jgi:hypothetical protein